MSQYFASAMTAAALHERLVDKVRTRVSVGGINMMPVAPRPEGVLPPVLHLRERDASPFSTSIARAVQALQSEPDLPPLFEQRGCAMRVEQAFGWERWLRSPTYQEHFREMNGARQLVYGICDSSRRPHAFIAVCRTEDDPPFTVEDEALVLALRDEAERALFSFEITNDWSRPRDAILESITLALPVPALLSDGSRILWMNHEAELRLGIAALSFGGSKFFTTAGKAVEEVLACARRELHRPGATLQTPPNASECGWLLPGESVVARRIERAGVAEGVLICLCAGPVASRDWSVERVARVYGLTEREASVAVLAVRGYSVLGIASNLNIAESTVCTHMKRIYRKLGVRSRAELAWKIARGEGVAEA